MSVNINTNTSQTVCTFNCWQVNCKLSQHVVMPLSFQDPSINRSSENLFHGIVNALLYAPILTAYVQYC